MKKKPNIAIIGATGLVGITMLKVLEESDIEVGSLHLYASSRSHGKTLEFRGIVYQVKELTIDNVDSNIDIALFATSKEISKKFVPCFKKLGIYSIDNSSYFRNDFNIPLVVAGVNDNLITKDALIIANPNCSTIQSILAISLIDIKYKIKRIIYNTYQAVSGSGHLGVLDLVDGIIGKTNKFYSKPIAFNLIPIIGDVETDKDTSEEKKMINETKRILENDNLKISSTCVRVPVINSHSISINLECEETINLEELIKDLKKDDKLVIYDEDFPTPIEVSGSDQVHIGRIRIDKSTENGLNLWVVADNLRVGAATNAVKILKCLWKEIENEV